MEQRKIGALEVSVVGLGCNSFGRFVDEPRSIRIVQEALECGITFFDTANVYIGIDGASEMHLQKGLGNRRDEVFVATKFVKDPFGDEGRFGAYPAAIRTSIEGSLRRLKTDYIDLYQIHAPDTSIPIAETLGALCDLVAEGKVREIGHSQFGPPQMREAADVATEQGSCRFVATQTEWSLLARECETDVIPTAADLDVSVIPYWPLSSGLLTGKYGTRSEVNDSWRLSMVPNRDYFLTDRRFGVLRALEELGSHTGRTVLDMAMSWLVSRPEVGSVIAGATSPEQVRANVDASKVALTGDHLKLIDQVTLGPSSRT